MDHPTPNQDDLDLALFQAAKSHEMGDIDRLISMGANPFANVAPVELFVSRDGWEVRLAKGCAAAIAVQWPEVLARLLPASMAGWPTITQATGIWGVVSRPGQMVDLGHWAVEMNSLDGLRLLLDRLDMSKPESALALKRLTMSCLAGCSFVEANDSVLCALTLCMAREPDLDRGWSHWRHARMPSRNNHDEPVLMPMTFVLAMLTQKTGELWPHPADSLKAMTWALRHDDPVRDGDRCMGNASEDTFLHMAAASGNLQALRAGLELGCPLTVGDADGRTPLELARGCGRLESAAFIESWMTKKAMERAMCAEESS